MFLKRRCRLRACVSNSLKYSKRHSIYMARSAEGLSAFELWRIELAVAEVWQSARDCISAGARISASGEWQCCEYSHVVEVLNRDMALSF
jgi:hypothetical protein